MKTFYSLSFLGLLLLSLSFSVKAQDGEALFKQNCTACHSIGGGKLVGPDLKGVTERRKEEWLIKFIRSSQSLVKAGDKEAIALLKEYNQIPMPDHTVFSDEQIKSIITYLSKQSTGSTPKKASPEKSKSTAAPMKKSESNPDNTIPLLDINGLSRIIIGFLSFSIIALLFSVAVIIKVVSKLQSVI